MLTAAGAVLDRVPGLALAADAYSEQTCRMLADLYRQTGRPNAVQEITGAFGSETEE